LNFYCFNSTIFFHPVAFATATTRYIELGVHYFVFQNQNKKVIGTPEALDRK